MRRPKLTRVIYLSSVSYVVSHRYLQPIDSEYRPKAKAMATEPFIHTPEMSRLALADTDEPYPGDYPGKTESGT